MTVSYTPFVIVGKLARDYSITAGGEELNDKMGGNLFYTAAGLYHWEKGPGLLSRIGSDYPAEWIEALHKKGMNTLGIKRMPYPIEQRRFFCYRKEEKIERADAFSCYCDAELPMPHDLIGFTPSPYSEDSLTERTAETILSRDIPPEYLEARCIHFCPMDFLTHNLLPQAFMNSGQKTITLEPSRKYMTPHFWKFLPYLVRGISTFISSEEKIRKLFSEQFKFTELSDMGKEIQSWGVENVIIRLRNRDSILLNGVTHNQLQLSSYLEKPMNLTGEDDAFCGGYLAGLEKTYDPAQGLLYGMTASSFVSESCDPFSAFDVLPGLFEMRMAELAKRVVVL